MMKHLLFILLIVSVGCSSGDAGRQDNTAEAALAAIPEYVQELENLKVIEVDEEELDTVVLVREQEFGSNEEVFISGYLGEFVIDNNNRVYIEASYIGISEINIFEQDGSFITRIGREGRGPGEFQSIRSLDIQEDQLTVFDRVLQKFSVFQLNDFSLVREETIKRDEIRGSDNIAFITKGDRLIVGDSGSLMLSLNTVAQTPEDDVESVLIYRVSQDGNLIPGRVLELDRYSFFYRLDNNGNPTGVPFPMPFASSSLFDISDDGTIYSAWTEDFLIKVYNSDGDYQRSFYYPYIKEPLDIPAMNLSENRMDVLSDYPDMVPETWPALHEMTLDDQNRLWAFTITESDSTYQGWVLSPEGNLLARFEIAGSRNRRSVFAPSYRVVIKNNYLYIQESGEESDQIVKYGIKFRQR